MIPPRKTILLLAACLLLAATSAVGTAAAAPTQAPQSSLSPGPATGAEMEAGFDTRSEALVSATPTVQSSDNESAPSWGTERTDATASATDTGVINVTYEVDRTPKDVGTVRVNYTAQIPENVVEFQVVFQTAPFTVESTTNFNRRSSGFYNASSPRGETTTATITYTVEANTTTAETSGLNSVETNDWALVGAGQLSMNHAWSYFDTPPELRKHYAADGEGFAQDGRAFLGPHDRYRRSTSDQSFVLIVPDAADSTVPPGDVLDALARASPDLAVGKADPDVAAFVAPDPIRRGGRAGGEAFWVHESSGLTADSTWLHEYVHTRQAWVDGDVPLRIANDTEWFTEASADYYGARLAWQGGTTDTESFRSFVATDRYADSVLQDANNQSTEQKNYKKGRRVLAALDVRIRKQTDGNHTLLDVFRRVNSRSAENWLEYAELRGEVVALTNASTGNWLDNYVQTTDTPSIPPTGELEAVFANETTRGGSPSFQVSGLSPGDASVESGEAVNVSATVTNNGTANATQTVGVQFDGVVRATRQVTLGVDERTTVTFSLSTSGVDAGNYTYEVYSDNDSEASTLRVTDPTNVSITDLSPPNATVTEGAEVNVTATVRNDGASTVNETIEFRLDGTVATNGTVSLGPGENTTVGVTVLTGQLGPGTYTYGFFTTTDNQTDQLTVEAGGVVAQYDANDDGTISIRELGAAAADYVSGSIGIRALGEVAAAYASA